MSFHGNLADRKNDLLAAKTAYAKHQKTHFLVERSNSAVYAFSTGI